MDRTGRLWPTLKHSNQGTTDDHISRKLHGELGERRDNAIKVTEFIFLD